MKILIVFLLLLYAVPALGGPIPYPCQKKEYSAMCKPQRLKVTEQRLSVKCDIDKPDMSGGMPKFPYYSALLSQKNSPHLIDLLKSARLEQRRVRIYYSCPPEKNPPGCKADDCRRLKGIGF